MLRIVRSIVSAGAVLLLMAACQKALKAPVESSYLIKGNKQSRLYPLDVRQHSEDALIELKAGAPLPEIESLDAAGNNIKFNFHIVSNTIVVPGKFEHLHLHYGSDEAVDIFRQDGDK